MIADYKVIDYKSYTGNCRKFGNYRRKKPYIILPFRNNHYQCFIYFLDIFFCFLLANLSSKCGNSYISTF